MKTSTTHAIIVNWIHTDRPGKVGLTFAPGKKARGIDGHWHRDLATELDHLVNEYSAGLLVCLLQNHELQLLQIPGLIEAAITRMQVIRLPIPDGGVLPDAGPVRDVVAAIDSATRAGVNVVIHCRGGLGRAGTVGGCFLKSIGFDDDDTFTALKERHTHRCPETERQRQFIRAFTKTPTTTAPPPTNSRADRIAGAVLGATIGDAMGHPTEFMSMPQIHARYGAAGVVGFEKWMTTDGQRVAPYTADTQLSEAVVRALLDTDNNDLDVTMTTMAKRFVRWSTHPQGGHRAPGNACMSSCAALARGTPWREAGGATAGGCGSVMRAWPFGLFFVDDLDKAEAWAVAHSRLTHNDPIALAACAAIARGTALAVRGADIDVIVADMIAAAARWSEPTAALMQRAVDEARRGVGPEVTLDRLRGWAAHEAIAAAVYVFVRHAQRSSKAPTPLATATASPRSPAPSWVPAAASARCQQSGCATSSAAPSCWTSQRRSQCRYSDKPQGPGETRCSRWC